MEFEFGIQHTGTLTFAPGSVVDFDTGAASGFAFAADLDFRQGSQATFSSTPIFGGSVVNGTVAVAGTLTDNSSGVTFNNTMTVEGGGILNISASSLAVASGFALLGDDQANDLTNSQLPSAITGDIDLRGGDDVLNVNFTVDGDVFLGTGADTLTLSQALAAGHRANGGAGNDTMTGSTAADTLVGRDDDDSLIGNAGNDLLVGGDGNDTLLGGAGNDRLNGGSGNDSLNGGDNDDRLFGKTGQDFYQGGTGADRFVFRTVEEISENGLNDEIGDFSQGDGDRIDLRQIDADTTQDGDQRFALSQTGAFSNTAGELIFFEVDGQTLVQGDVDGDGTADFTLVLQGVFALENSDFLL